jgi:hypothetical protein
MERYLETVREAATVGKAFNQKDLCVRAAIHEQRVCDWKRLPWFRSVLREALREGLQCSPWLEAEYAAAGRARRGSIRDWELYLLAGGPTSWRDAVTGDAGGDAAQTVNGVIVNLHGIPTTAADRSTLPPPIMRHPVTGEIVPIPPAVPLPLAGGPQTPAATGA